MGKKSYIYDLADLAIKDEEKSFKEQVDEVAPKRRAIMTSEDDEKFIKRYYSGRTDCFRSLLREDKDRKGWRR